MANNSLSDTASRANFFKATVLNNLRYWQGWLESKSDDIAALDRERNSIVRAISFALNSSEVWPLTFELLQKFTSFMERSGHWEAWHWVLVRALKTARRFEDTAAEVTLSALLARLLFQQSRFKESIAHYRRTLHLARQVGDRFNEARACTNLGYYFAEKGRWQRAEVLCCHALALFEQLDNNHGRAHTENHLGFLYSRQHQWNKAQHHLQRACNIWQTMGDEHGLMRGYLNLGLSYVDARQPDQALIYLKKAFHRAQLTRETIAVGRVYTNMGKAYRLSYDWVKAEAYMKQAEDIFQQYLDLSELARTWNELGLLFCKQKRWSEAYSYLEKSLSVWRQQKIEFEEIELLLDIGECELSQDNLLQAAARLREVEQRIGQAPEQGPYLHLRPRLNQYRDNLNKSLGEKMDGSVGCLGGLGYRSG